MLAFAAILATLDDPFYDPPEHLVKYETPQQRRSYTAWASKLRDDLIGDDSGYDQVVPPRSDARSAGGDGWFTDEFSAAGTVVGLQIRFFKVESVKASEGAMRLKVWVRCKWQDSRLAWNASEYGGITWLPFLGNSLSAPEDTEIWLPDLQPYNTITGIIDSLDAAVAQVSSDGTVFWSRPGLLDVMCKFSGLVAFPYDSMRCSIEVGGWALDGNMQGIKLGQGPGNDKGYDINFQEQSQGTSYQEYEIRNVTADLVNYQYPCCPYYWPNAVYRITLQRATSYYEFFIIYPVIILTLCSFFPFYMSFEVGERLSYGITLVLCMTTYQALATAMLPVCGELLWIELFNFYCFIFSM